MINGARATSELANAARVTRAKFQDAVKLVEKATRPQAMMNAFAWPVVLG